MEVEDNWHFDSPMNKNDVKIQKYLANQSNFFGKIRLLVFELEGIISSYNILTILIENDQWM